MIVINRAKAEASTRDRLRAEREPRLAELDVRFMRALEAGEDTAPIASAKQALRDVTEKPLDGLTIEQLTALTLDGALAL
jgi:hypothetical protein